MASRLSRNPFPWITMLVFFLSGFSCLAPDEPKAGSAVGGRCKYKTYKGLAKIISIQKKDVTEQYGGPSYQAYEVKFTFHTDRVIQEKHGQVDGKEHLLLLANSWYPGPEFLRKYGIAVGETFECDLEVITQGTCSPVVFRFPQIDLSDYFESRQN